MESKAKAGWRQRGYNDARAGRKQRAPLRDDDGEAFSAYMAGYRDGLKTGGGGRRPEQ